MKKAKIKSKLNLDRMTVAKLNDHQTEAVVGGGFLSIGRACTKANGGCSNSKGTKGIWCNLQGPGNTM